MQLVPQTRKLISLGFAWSPVLLMRWVVQHRAYVLNNGVCIDRVLKRCYFSHVPVKTAAVCVYGRVDIAHDGDLGGLDLIFYQVPIWMFNGGAH